MKRLGLLTVLLCAWPAAAHGSMKIVVHRAHRTARASQPSWTSLPTPASVASAHWPDSPCRGHEVVVLVSREQAADTFPLGGDIGGWVDMAAHDCTAYIATSPWAARHHRIHFCGVLVHEFGHLAGLGHSDDPQSVMNPALVIAQECWQLTDDNLPDQLG